MTELFNLKMLGGRKNNTNSVYSMVSCSDLTPGSLEVWEALPNEIKFDPSLAPFKTLYEQNRGKLDSTLDDEEIQNDTTEIDPISGNGDPVKDNEEDEYTEPTQVEGDSKRTRKRKLKNAARTIKLTALVACWMVLTVSLLLNREKSDTVLHTAVIGGETKEYPLNSLKDDVRVLITITGPFLSSGQDNRTRANLLQLWLHRNFNIEDDLFQQNSTIWEVYIQDEAKIDFAPSETESRTLYLANTEGLTNKNSSEDYKNTSPITRNDVSMTKSNLSLRMYTSSNCTVPLTVSYMRNPLTEEDGIIYATLLLCCLYILIIFEIVNRTIAALLSSSLGIAVLALAGERPTLTELMTWLDAETLLLLFSMMILVAILAETGLFDFLAVLAFEELKFLHKRFSFWFALSYSICKVTGGRTWPLVNCLSIFTAVFSTFLDNVTTVLLMTPVTIRLCEVMQLNPIPVLMSMVIFSNVGGAATPVGDPPNVIIASHPSVLRENINFTTFTVHMGVGILLVCVQTYLQLRYMFRDMNKLRNTVPADILELRQEVSVWRRAAASLTSYSRDEDIVKKALEKKVEKLSIMLKKREAGGGTSKSDPVFCSTLAQMKLKYRIRDKQLLIKSVICITFVVIVFFLHAFPQLQSLSLGWTALLGALLLLLLAERDDLEPILARVEWSTLLFFAALFILMEALSKLGMISWIGRLTEKVILKVNEESRLAVAILLVLWVSGIASAFVDNIPLTTMMVRVTATLADGNSLGLPLAPLVWALSFGACLGGNGTLIGASANVVCAGVAEQHGYRFTFLEYIKIGFPIMIGNLTVASIYLLICHCIFQWH